MKLTPTEILNVKLSRLSLETYTKVIDDRDFNTARSMYRSLLEIATVNHDAIVSIRQSRADNYRPASDSPSPEDFPTYTMTSGGRLWIWNCGWIEINKQGKQIAPPIGHLAFRKFKLAKKSKARRSDDWFKVCRPEGPWRRHIDCVLEHPEFGNGKVLATDGIHAIFEYTVLINPETNESVKRKVEVSFSRLRELGYRTSHNSKSVKPITKSEKPKSPLTISSIALDLL